MLEVWTDGSIVPVDAVKQAANVLVNQFFLFAGVQPGEDGVEGASIGVTIPAEQYNIPVERLELSSRTLNCLKRAGLNKVGEVLELTKVELLRIRNFGEKSYTELYGRLRDMDLVPPELDPEATEETEQDGSAQEAEETPEEPKA